MSRRRVRFVLFVAILTVAPYAGAEQKTAVPPAPTSLITMLCTQDGVSKALKGKDLEEFVAKCTKAKKPALEKNDAPVADDMPNCRAAPTSKLIFSVVLDMANGRRCCGFGRDGRRIGLHSG